MMTINRQNGPQVSMCVRCEDIQIKNQQHLIQDLEAIYAIVTVFQLAHENENRTQKSFIFFPKITIDFKKGLQTIIALIY